eukprot:COSAG06_NODE_1159_length_10463_cov_10.703975_1_plen_141_part_10
MYRWPRAKKEGLVGGYEKDTQAEIKNIQSRVNKIADVLEVPEESVSSYEFLNDPESVADVIEEEWSASSWAVIWGSLFKFLETIGHDKTRKYQTIFSTEKFYHRVQSTAVSTLSEREATSVRKAVLELWDPTVEFIESDDA